MTPYFYQATVTEIYDGDTWTLDIDLGFHTTLNDQKIRLFGLDTPEVRGKDKEKGKEVRDWCRDNFLNRQVTIQTIKDKKGKYGRWLGIIHYRGRNINQYLVDSNRAVAKDY